MKIFKRTFDKTLIIKKDYIMIQNIHKLFFAMTVFTLSGCAQDKQAHFIAGSLTSLYVEERTGSKIKGCLAATGIGLAKEYIVDEIRHGEPDFMDAVATGVGCSILVVEW
jgi:hypothetical protein